MKQLAEITTFKNLIELVAEEYGDRVALQIRRRIRNEQYKYKDLPAITNKISNFLEKQGIGRDERIFIWGLNCPEYVLLLLAIFASKRVAVPIDFRTNEDTIKKIVEQTKPKAAFVSMLVDNKFVKSQFDKVFHLEELMNLVEQESPEYKTPKAKKGDEDKICEILYTSGTTGVPKGVEMKERNIIGMAKVAQNYIPKLKKYRTISMLPLSHVFEQVLGTAVALSLGSSTTYLTRINSAKMRKAMQEVKPTYMVFVPQLLSIFWQRIEQTAKAEGKIELINKLVKLGEKLPSFISKMIFKKVHDNFGGNIEFIAVSGAPLNVNLAQKYVNMGFRILEVYGATEILASNINDSRKFGIGHVGPTVDTVEMKLDDEKEIWIKSPYTTPGYFQNPKKNAETFDNGWYRTGDIGEITKEGYLKIVGRDKFKLVLQNGENVFVEDMERKINAHPDIKDSVIIGLDDDGADKIFACFIPKDEVTSKKLDSIVKEINEQLESKQQILEYMEWKNDDFPRTHTLKINRQKIKDTVAKNQETGKSNEMEVATAASSQMDVYDVIAFVSKKDRIEITDDLILTSDLDMDSLLRAELTAVIEENLGVVIDAIKINAQTTVKDISDMVDDAEKSALEAPHFPTWQYTKFWDITRKLVLNLIVIPLQAIFIRIKLIAPESFDKFDPSGRIIIYNHPGLFDFLVLVRTIGKGHRAVGLAGHGFWSNKLAGKILELGGSFPLDQTGGQLIQQSQIVSDLLDEGRYVILAPQGTIQRVEGVEDPFQTGVGFLAAELDVPILPVKIKGYDKIMVPPPMSVGDMNLKDWLKYGRPHKFGTVEVVVGEELLFKRSDSPEKITKQIQAIFNKM